jgi:hypothetical protein
LIGWRRRRNTVATTPGGESQMSWGMERDRGRLGRRASGGKEDERESHRTGSGAYCSHGHLGYSTCAGAKQYSLYEYGTYSLSRRFIRRETFTTLASIADIIKRPSFSRRSGPPGFFTPAALSNQTSFTLSLFLSLSRKYYHPSTPALVTTRCRDRATCEHPVPPTLCLQAVSRS